MTGKGEPRLIDTKRYPGPVIGRELSYRLPRPLPAGLYRFPVREPGETPGSEWNDVFGLRALLPFADRELDLLAFLQCASARAFYGAKVHEYILFALAGDESITLRVVKPLDGTNQRF